MGSPADTLDMSSFFGTPEQKKEFCISLLESLKKRGCVKIQNHGIADEMIHELFAMVNASFSVKVQSTSTNSTLD